MLSLFIFKTKYGTLVFTKDCTDQRPINFGQKLVQFFIHSIKLCWTFFGIRKRWRFSWKFVSEQKYVDKEVTFKNSILSLVCIHPNKAFVAYPGFNTLVSFNVVMAGYVKPFSCPSELAPGQEIGLITPLPTRDFYFKWVYSRNLALINDIWSLYCSWSSNWTVKYWLNLCCLWHYGDFLPLNLCFFRRCFPRIIICWCCCLSMESGMYWGFNKLTNHPTFSALKSWESKILWGFWCF